MAHFAWSVVRLFLVSSLSEIFAKSMLLNSFVCVLKNLRIPFPGFTYLGKMAYIIPDAKMTKEALHALFSLEILAMKIEILEYFLPLIDRRNLHGQHDLMSNPMALKPWLHHENRSASSLTDLGMELAIPPSSQAYPTLPTYSEFSNKALPLLPSNSLAHQGREGAKSTEPPSPSRMKTSPPKKGKRLTLLALDPRETRSASDISKAKLPPPPPTPMSKSSRKVLQLTGFNPNYEKTFQDELHHLDSDSTSSSSSVYSQDEGITAGIELTSKPENLVSVTPFVKDIPAEDPDIFLWSKAYNSGGESSTKRHDRRTSSQASSTCSLRQTNKSDKILGGKPQRDEVTAYEVLVARERSRFENMGDEVWGQNIGNFNDHRSHFEQPMQEGELVPQPLAIRTRKQPSVQEERPVSRFSDHSSEDNSHSIFSTARDSFTWGMRELSSPLKTKHGGPPSSSPGKMAPLPKPKRQREFNSGNHPLKSPFPFISPARRASELSSPSTSNEMRKRLSGAMNRISGSGNGTKETIISNAARRPSGPDTPAPNKIGLMARLHDSADVIQKGNLHLQDAVAKAKKSVKFKSEDERRRDNLRKNIQIIGPSDQTPGM